MREVKGAVERPSASRIEIQSSDDAVVIRIPPPRLPWPVYAGAAVAAASLLAALIIGASIFVLRRAFPGYQFIVGGHYAPQPLAWDVAGLFGFVLVVPGALVLLAAAVRPLTRSEEIRFPTLAATKAYAGPEVILLKTSEFGRANASAVAALDVLRFELHRDPQGLVESEIVVETRSALAQGRLARRTVIAASVLEPEREWLASVLNALLASLRSDTAL